MCLPAPAPPGLPAAELLQAKALLALALLCRTPTGLACVVSWHGLLPQLERLCSRERLSGGGGSASEQYMAATVAGLHQQLAANVVPVIGVDNVMSRLIGRHEGVEG